MTGKKYQHYKNNIFYKVLYESRLQLDNEWHHAIVYQVWDMPEGNTFVRLRSEFEEKFTEIKD